MYRNYRIDQTVKNVIICPECKSNDITLINSIHHDCDYPNLQKYPDENKGRKGHFTNPALFQCKKCKCVFPDNQEIDYEPIPQTEPIIW